MFHGMRVSRTKHSRNLLVFIFTGIILSKLWKNHWKIVFLHGYYTSVHHEWIICKIYNFSLVKKYFPIFNRTSLSVLNNTGTYLTKHNFYYLIILVCSYIPNLSKLFPLTEIIQNLPHCWKGIPSKEGLVDSVFQPFWIRTSVKAFQYLVLLPILIN